MDIISSKDNPGLFTNEVGLYYRKYKIWKF